MKTEKVLLLEKAYFSCFYLEEGLNISQNWLTHCCIIHSEGKKGSVRIGNFDGNVFPIELVLNARRKLIADNQTECDTPCKGCHFLEKKVWPKNKYFFRSLTINDWDHCNLKCDYCYTQIPEWQLHEDRTHELVPLIEDMVKNEYLAPDAVIVWGGGEVTVYRDFEPVAELLMQNNFKQYVNTNAVLYSKAIEQGLMNGKIDVQVSVDAGTRETYKNVKGKDAFDIVWRNISKYSAFGQVTAKYIAKKNNSGVPDIVGFLSHCQNSGVYCVCVAPELSEYSHNAISEETLWNVALMIYLANQGQIPINEDLGTFPEDYAEKIKFNLSAFSGIQFYDRSLPNGCGVPHQPTGTANRQGPLKVRLERKVLSHLRAIELKLRKLFR